MLAVPALATEQLQQLTLDPAADADQKVLTVQNDNGQLLTLEFALPYLNLETMDIEGENYQALTIQGGNLRGEVGQAALPTVSRFVMVPDDAAVNIELGARHEQVFADFRLFPVQPDESETFVIDPAYYAAGDLDTPPLVEVGAPAIMHGMRVVPLTISPVSYDPTTGEVRVIDRCEITVDFSGVDTRNGVAPQHDRIPESFHNMYQETVVNYRSDGAEVGLGTYLFIYRNSSGVLSALQPLIDWRERQGYNVVVAHSGQTGTTRNNIKNYIQNVFNSSDPPLEFVTLIGDVYGDIPMPCWYESVSGYQGEGDHYYTTLAGGDMLSDVHFGRLSVRNAGSLSQVVNKIVTYETNPPAGDAGWFSRACLVGDPSSSGATCIFVNQWVKSQLLNAGYTHIDTLWYGSQSHMSARINAGLSVFGYRGYWYMSGMDSGHISALSNGNELPFAVIPTCDTGSFSDDNNCRSEAFLRNPSGGGIGAIGTATIGTHTRYNNCYYQATWDGAINSDCHRLGVAHTMGKNALWINYIDYEASKVEIWSMWNNLMGDPATPMWTAAPRLLTVDYPAIIPNGVGSVNILVADGEPIENALVTLFKDGALQVSGYTDHTGSISLPISGVSSGTVLVTVTEHNYRPHLGSFDIGAVTNYPAVSNYMIDDDGNGTSNGNNDGMVNAGEAIELPVALHNYGTNSASNVTAVLSTGDPYVTITDATETFGTIAAGTAAWSADDFDINILSGAPAGHVVNLDVTASSGGNTWTSLIQLTIDSAAFDYTGYSWGGPGGSPDQGESGTIAFTVQNTGSVTATGVTATLFSMSPWITIDDANGSYSNIAPGGSATNNGNPFSLTVDPDCFDGHLATFILELDFNGTSSATTEIGISIGTLSSNDPIGPDAYGYYAFDNTDTAYDLAPTYSWVEIAPNYGGNGTSVGLGDFGWEQDDYEVKNLPFDFQFYGMTYDQISIGSNGFLSFGVCSNVTYQNRTMPGPGNSPNMVAVYWDNLYQTGSNRCYYWHDTNNDRYIVQWSRMRADYNNATQNVQVILYDPAVHETATGDGLIVMQYAQVSNTDSRDAYATVGICNNDRDDGLMYTYGGDYPVGAPSLTAGRAIAFVPAAAPIEPPTAVDEMLPTRLALLPSHPNPFNPKTMLRFELPREQTVSLRIFDITGRLVRTVLEDEHLAAGRHGYEWDGVDGRNSPVGSGVYFYVLDTPVQRLSGRMTLLK